MKQILLIIIAAILLLAGCSNTSNNSNNNQNTSITNEQTETSQPEKYLTTDKLFPASYSIKVVTQDYHLNMRPLSDKAIMRVTKEIVINNKSGKDYDTYLRKIEILDNDKIAFQQVIPADYTLPSLYLVDCRIFKGNNNDFFAYSIDSPYGAEHSIRYDVIKITKDNDNYKAVKLDGELPSDTSPNSPIPNNYDIPIVTLDKGKYITVYYFDELLPIESELEFTDTSLNETDKEFRIVQVYGMDGKIMHNTNAMKEAGSIELYSTYKQEDKPLIIPLTEKSNVEILGGRHIYGNIYSISDTSIHVIIDRHKGWVSARDYLEKLGFHN